MKSVKYILMGALALALVACEKDFFETDSPSAMDVSVFKSADMTEQAIGAIYNIFGEDKSFRNRLCGGYVAMNTDTEHCNKGSGQAKESAIYALSKGTGDLSTSNGKDPWAYLNAAVERCNVVVDGIREYSDTTDANFKYLLGEALTLRAFCYLELVKLWGDVPACFKSFDGKDLNELYVKKSDRNVIFEHLRADLQEAARLMPWSENCPGKAANFTGRASKALAYGLLARADMMYAGKAMRPRVFTEGGTTDCAVLYNIDDATKRAEVYQEAVWACAQIINHENKLEANYEDIWKKLCADETSYGNSEFIWALPFRDGNRGQVLCLNGLKISSNAPEAIKNANWAAAGSNDNAKVQGMIQIVPTFALSFAENDTRKDVTVCPYQWEFDAGNGVASDPSLAFPQTESTKKKLYQKYQDISSMYLGKFRIEWMKRTYSSNEDCVDMPILRYADVLLMFAEAAAANVDGYKATNTYGVDPQAAFDKVRERAGLAPVALTLENIQQERAFEFCGENIRKYDLMRWGILGKRLVETQAAIAELDAHTGAYAGMMDSVYFKYRLAEPGEYAKAGYDAYVLDTIVGLRIGDTTPAEYDKAAGWVKKAIYEKEGDRFLDGSTVDGYRLYSLDYDGGDAVTQVDLHQYWPIFEVNINASNGTLWNDYAY